MVFEEPVEDASEVAGGGAHAVGDAGDGAEDGGVGGDGAAGVEVAGEILPGGGETVAVQEEDLSDGLAAGAGVEDLAGVVGHLAELPGREGVGGLGVQTKIDAATRAAHGSEMRFHPSTYRTATLGGFIAGGSGGVGSIRWGGLRNFGNIIGLKVVTCEATPRILDLVGTDILKVAHAYGTNGIIVEAEIPQTAAYDWIDVIAGFDSIQDACRFGRNVAMQDGLLLKEIAPVAAPVPHDYFVRHQKFIRRDQSVVVMMVAPQAMHALGVFLAHERGEMLYRSDQASADDLELLPPAYELTWNHTTLRALKVDPTVTYLQTQYPDLETLYRIIDIFGDEMPMHNEMIRFDGRVVFSGLPIVRFTSEERLEEIIRIHEEVGARVFNPHRYTLEEGGMKRRRPRSARLQARGRPGRHPQPRQDDRLGEPGFRLHRRNGLPLLEPRPRRTRLTPMRVLVIQAHPVETSYSAALATIAIEMLQSNGHVVDSLDLYVENFEAVLSREERLIYHDVAENMTPAIRPYVERIKAAEALVFVYPVWNFGMPAILKGFFDRVFVPGVAFEMRDGQLIRVLSPKKKVAVITTYGGPRRRAFLVGDPPRKIRATRLLDGLPPVPPGAVSGPLRHEQ